jgi:hypothetical protein
LSNYKKMATDLVPKSSSKLGCKICDFNTCRQSQLTRHISTQKHLNATKELLKATNLEDQKCDANGSKYQCINCDKKYKHHSSLWKHNKCCTEKKDCLLKDEQDPTEKELIISLIKDNKALQELVIEQSKKMMELCKSGTGSTNTNSNNNNKIFNLQIFLNEDCKDALNISEFVSSIKMDLNDLEKTGRLGYVTGVSNIINKNLSDLDQTMRPIHCSDAKREVFYVKSEDQWIKETDDNKPILTKAIKQIGRENIKQISEWQKKNPDCKDPDSKKNDMYLDIVSNAMSGGSNEEQLHNYEKIITNVAKEVIIEKA